MECLQMNYTFMHQNLPVAELELDDASGFIIKINNVYRPEHLPVGVSIAGQTGRLQRVDQVSGKHWRHWKLQIQKCFWCGVLD